jgi:hypothetical protein
MKINKIVLVLLLLANIFWGINAQAQKTVVNNKTFPSSGTNDKIAVNGNMAVRGSLATTTAGRVLTMGAYTASPSSAQLQQTDAFLMYHSSGLIVKQTSDNNWNGIYVGSTAARLDFTLKGHSGGDFTISFLYVVGQGFTLLGTPVNCTYVGSDTNYFTVSAAFSYTFVFTTNPNGTININVPSSGGSWTQGTIRSIPILN